MDLSEKSKKKEFTIGELENADDSSLSDELTEEEQEALKKRNNIGELKSRNDFASNFNFSYLDPNNWTFSSDKEFNEFNKNRAKWALDMYKKKNPERFPGITKHEATHTSWIYHCFVCAILVQKRDLALIEVLDLAQYFLMQLREIFRFGIEYLVRRLTIDYILGEERLDYRLRIYLSLACGTCSAHLEAKKQNEIGVPLY